MIIKVMAFKIIEYINTEYANINDNNTCNLIGSVDKYVDQTATNFITSNIVNHS